MGWRRLKEDVVVNPLLDLGIACDLVMSGLFKVSKFGPHRCSSRLALAVTGPVTLLVP